MAALSGCSANAGQEQKSLSLTEYLSGTKENWFLTGKKEYTIQAMMVSQEKTFHNDLEVVDYAAADEGETVVLKGTRDEIWTSPLSKVIARYKKPDGSGLSKEDFVNKDVFIDIVAIPTTDTYYAMHVPKDIAVVVETAQGDMLHTNLPNAPHGEGDYLICTIGEDGGPNLSDIWVLNGLIFWTAMIRLTSISSNSLLCRGNSFLNRLAYFVGRDFFSCCQSLNCAARAGC